ILADAQAAMHTGRDDMLQGKRDVVVKYAMACIQAGRLFNQVAGDPDKHADMLKLIVKSILPRDEALLKAVAPHWEWIAEDGMPNVASIMAEHGFWADSLRKVEKQVPQGRGIEASIAKEAVQGVTAERAFG